jgi:hypothetical protein
MPNIPNLFNEPASLGYEIDLPWLTKSDWQHGANPPRTIVPDWQKKLPVAIEAFYQSILSKFKRYYCYYF